MPLNRNDVRKHALPREFVEVPELGGEVVVRGLRLSERLELATAEGGHHLGALVRLLHWCVIDEDGEPLMTVAEWEDWGGACSDAAVRLLEVAQRLSGLRGEDAKKK
jgi:hypothetical protein